jgi:hypothetical protein
MVDKPTPRFTVAVTSRATVCGKTNKLLIEGQRCSWIEQQSSGSRHSECRTFGYHPCGAQGET